MPRLTRFRPSTLLSQARRYDLHGAKPLPPGLTRIASEWHGGQGSGLYSVASLSVANERIPLDSLRRALADLRWEASDAPIRSARQKRELDALVRALERRVPRPGGRDHWRGVLKQYRRGWI